jgi:hypothetical protein
MSKFIIAVLIIAVLYLAKFPPLLTVVYASSIYWNEFIITITTFKDHHPYILLAFPLFILLLLIPLRE